MLLFKPTYCKLIATKLKMYKLSLMGSNYKAKIIILFHTTPLLQRTHNLFD